MGRAARARRRGYRAQLAYLFERSAFYRDKLTRRDRSAQDAGGLAEIAALPLTEKAELRATHAPTTRSARTCASTRRDRPDLLDERHDRRAELHPAHRRRSRQLGHGLGAQLRGLGRRRRAADRQHLQRRPVRRRRRARGVRPARPRATSRSAPATRSACCARSSACARGGCADAVVCRATSSSRRRSAASTCADSSVERVLVAGEPGGGEPAFRAQLERAGARR